MNTHARLTPMPFKINATAAELDDLRHRLRNTRWPDAETVNNWDQGTPLSNMKDLAIYWAEEYDWRSREASLNELTQWRANVDGLNLHFIHMRSPHDGALPLLLSHGWPGSIVEFAKVIPRLLDPVAFGGHADDAFHVIAPSLPGFGFSDKPVDAGTGVMEIATVFDQLMRGLGYDHYVAQGGDFGSMVTTCIGAQNRGACAGIHLNMQYAVPTADDLQSTDPVALEYLDDLQAFRTSDMGYAHQQSTRPQSLGYGLADSPVGQAAWIYEKFWRWSDNDGDIESILTRDEILDNIMMYWLPNTATSSARLYWESYGPPPLEETGPVQIPAGCSVFPREILRPPREWVARTLANITYWNVLEKGGHFAAFEQPEIFTHELRTFFRNFR